MSDHHMAALCSLDVGTFDYELLSSGGSIVEAHHKLS